MAKYMKYHHHLLLLFLLLIPSLVSGGCECGSDKEQQDKPEALKLKYIGMASILVASALGILIPILGRHFNALHLEDAILFAIKSFAAGVILATAMIHILPHATKNLTSPCLKENPWQMFPFTGLIAMVSALGTMVVDNLAMSYYQRAQLSKAQPMSEGDEEAHATHGPSHGLAHSFDGENLRPRVVSQVLELGIAVHSVIIGIAMGTLESSSTIRPIVGALCFHQFFEGMGLGGCIVEARFKAKTTITMVIFFCLTAPVGVAVGIGIASSYDESSPEALIVEGVLESASFGILIYTALVDLLAEDFRSPKMQKSGGLQLLSYSTLFLGAGLMSLLGIWA